MAMLSTREGEKEIQMTNISDNVLIIRAPGLDTEEVLHRFPDVGNRRLIGGYRNEIMGSPTLNDAQKFDAIFWLGYFYRSFC